ncbi:MAG: NADH-quinone oxidoreductase subunit NuoF [Clostridiales bacterium]|nr:MAG: NADH-quinone oxidoreductase subunit NuoF [Clostridiales bacterium]
MLKSREDLINLRASCKKSLDAQTKKILVCAGTGCIASGSLDIYAKLVNLLKEKNIRCSVELEEEPHDESVGVKKCGCHGFCEMGPLVRIEPQGWLYTKVKLEDCEDIIEKTIAKNELIERLAYHQNDKVYPKQDEIPFYKKQTRLVLEHCGHIDADSIQEYIALGGYSALEKVLFDLDGDEVVKTIKDSNLRGRGGAGFPAGIKWETVRKTEAEQKYILCNGDEGDPGAFMDRSIMEGDPHRVLEGMMVAGRAVGATKGYIYVRAEYPMAVARLQNAIKQALEIGILGENILGSGFDFTVHINCGAGAFVCGEETALIASIEGERGFPRVRPPLTVIKGLFGCPTVPNNVETYANVPLIINRGADWYNSIGCESSSGTKAFALTGNIQNTGLIEIPMGTTLREVIYDIGGGCRGGADFKAVQIGGPSGGCLTKDNLDLPLDYDSLKSVGAMIGSGGLVVMDEHTCIVEVARFFMNFTQNESCGKCVPCREGTKRMLEILENIVEGKGKESDIDLLLELSEMITSTALCGLGKTAPNPVRSTIKNFRDEYEAHIHGTCPTGTCSKLKKITIEASLCKGCGKCSRLCPAGAISGKVKEPFVIDQSKCIKCGACVESCPFHAIKEN